LRTGGAVIAFVGPDATGKSTLISECGHWLAEVFVVRIVHAGKPPSTYLTMPIDVVVPLARNLLPKLRTGHLERYSTLISTNNPQQKNKSWFSLLYALRAVTLAWNRQHLLVKARRAAANGEIVLCDRYPSERVGVMDSRKLQENSNSKGMAGFIYNRLAHLEKQLYKQIPPPDIVLQLSVSMETAKKRNRERVKKAKGSDAHIEFRHSQNQNWYMPGTKYIYDIDTERPLNETIDCTKQIIWELL
jgi:thymidylate kinase